MQVLGVHMCEKLQRKALARFVHRYTGTHKPQWAYKPWKNEQGKTVYYPVQFADDQDWLAHTYFEVTKQGELDNRIKYCESHPTWPNNPEFRKEQVA